MLKCYCRGMLSILKTAHF